MILNPMLMTYLATLLHVRFKIDYNSAMLLRLTLNFVRFDNIHGVNVQEENKLF